MIEYLEKFPFWEQLTEEERQFVERGSIVRDYPRGSIIYSSGADCLGMTILLYGEMRACVMSEEGREITLYRLHDGDFCMLTASCVLSQITFETQIAAVSDCRLLVIAPVTMKRLVDTNVWARCFVYELAAARFSTVMATMQDIIFKGFDRRLAKFLVGEYERTGGPIRMTHEQIAQYTSSAREVVARMTRRFAEDGLIEAKRGEIRLIDVDALRLMI